MRVRTVLLGLWLLAAGPALANPGPIAERITAATSDAEEARKLHLVYDDVHGLYGGTRFELTGGVLVHTHVPRGGQPTVETRRALSSDELKGLLVLLQAERVWEQRIPERPPFPDESQAVLTVSMGDARATTWEWFNDLGQNDRLVKVERALLALVPSAAP